jgi:DNA-binding NarL/FixJ family response regulator
VQVAKKGSETIQSKVKNETCTVAPLFDAIQTDREECAPISASIQPRPMRVLIADDHRIMRQSISKILQSRADIQVCGEAVDGKDAVEKARLLKPDLLIIDVSLRDLSGLEVATAVRAFLPKVPVLFLSAYGGEQLNEEAKRLGFQGFVSKNDAAKSLLSAVDAIGF